jgi:hypothetical protein
VAGAQASSKDAAAPKADPSQVGVELPKRGMSRAAIAVAAVLALGVIGVGVNSFLQWQQDSRARAEQAVADAQWQDAHGEVAVDVSVALSDYSADSGSGIPIKIEGTDLDGNEVSKTVVIQPPSERLMLLRGRYTISVAGTPASADGTLYELSSEPVSVVITEKGTIINGSDPAQLQSFELKFEPMAADAVTEDDIKQLSEWMAADGVDEDRAATLVSAAKAKRQKASDEKASQKAAEDRAAAQAAAASAASASTIEAPPAETATGERMVVSTKDFDFAIPEAWRGRVEWVAFDLSDGYTEVDIYPVGMSEYVGDYDFIFSLARIRSYSPDHSKAASDGHTVRSYVEAPGKLVEVSMPNWPSIAVEHLNGQVTTDFVYDFGQLDTLVSLATGGQANVASIQQAGSAAQATEAQAALERQIAESVAVK